MDLNVQINGQEIKVGMDFDRLLLSRAGIGKMNFLTRACLPWEKRPGDAIFWVRNAQVSFFGEEVIASPVLNPNELAREFPFLDARARTDMLCATSATLFFNHSVLRCLIVQLIGSSSMAQLFTVAFRKAACGKLGDAEAVHLVGLPGMAMGVAPSEVTHLLYKWRSAGEKVISEIGSSAKNAFIHWNLE